MESINIKHTVGQSIQEFYDKHDFGEDGGVNEKYAWIKFGFSLSQFQTLRVEEPICIYTM